MKKLLMIGFCLMMVAAASVSVASARIAETDISAAGVKDPHENHANGNITCWNIRNNCAENDGEVEQ